MVEVQELGKELIRQAVEEQAQDIYLLPKPAVYKIYLRFGEKRHLIQTCPPEQAAGLISHFKFLAGMNVGEKRRAQLGACDYAFADGETAALRLSTVGDYQGRESLVIRLLFDRKRELKFWFDGLNALLPKITGRGLYLFSGPVGSGKTTLMYELVSRKYPDSQIITIEDPVEIKQDNMLQLQLNPSIGMTYDHLIKLSLRHRPDVLIIGEIRDRETAQAVIRASLTGIRVFSTVHAKSIPGVYARILELGVSQDELDNCLAGIAYQRLIGGGGLIDFAQDHFQNHQAECWNEKIDQLLAAGHLTEEEAAAEKIKD
ncbi:competence type IV pilus ATPase ComGA [Streptococcus sobrinus]|uniref:competence type IV pilus ATPase ComGA n=1 Tax=Streptococcus sobrinus TaxID=1310 RepID=UPI0003166E4E|nr:competence type IV pilus ATPase ComGA [Streptococcus sobrinus]